MSMRRYICPSSVVLQPTDYAMRAWIHTGKKESSSPNLLEKRLSEIHANAFSKNIPDGWQAKPAHEGKIMLSTSAIGWQVAPHAKDSDNASPLPISSDKDLLLRKLYLLWKKGEVQFHDKISLLSEGCDNGNHLPLSLAVLTTPKEGEIKKPEVSIVTTDISLLYREASRVAWKILDNQDKVFAGFANAYQCPPSIILEKRSYQMISMPFRLGMTEEAQKIQTYIQKRFEFMQKDDLFLITFLLENDQNDKVFRSEYKYTINYSTGGVRGYTKAISEKVFNRLSETIRKKEPSISIEKGDCCQHVKAFSSSYIKENLLKHEKIDTLWTEAHETKTDDNHAITTLIAICRKN